MEKGQWRRANGEGQMATDQRQRADGEGQTAKTIFGMQSKSLAFDKKKEVFDFFQHKIFDWN